MMIKITKDNQRHLCTVFGSIECNCKCIHEKSASGSKELQTLCKTAYFEPQLYNLCFVIALFCLI